MKSKDPQKLNSITSIREGYISRIKNRAEGQNAPAWLKQNGKSIAKQARAGKLDLDLVEKVSRGLTDGAYYEDEDFQNFFIALGRCQFHKLPEKGQGFDVLIDVLIGRKKGTPAQRERAQEMIKHYAFKVKENHRVEDGELEEMISYVVGGDEVEEQIEQATGSLASPLTFVERAGIKGAAEKIVQRKSSVFIDEVFPQEMSGKLFEGKKQEALLMGEYNQLCRQEDQNIDLEVGKRLNAQIQVVADKLSAHQKSLEVIRAQEKNFYLRMMARYDAKERIAKDLGVPELTKGQIFTTETGDQIEITGIQFTRRENTHPDSAGTAYVQYKLNGKVVNNLWSPFYPEFLQRMWAESAQPKITTLEQLNKCLMQLDKTPLAVGDEFQALYRKEDFIVKRIDSNGFIILNKPVEIRPPESLSDALDADKHHSIKKSKLTFGEFAKLVISLDYIRSVSPDQVQELLDRHQKQGRAMTSETLEAMRSKDPEKATIFEAVGGVSPEHSFQAPNLARNNKPVYFRDVIHVYQGYLSLAKDGNYQFKAQHFYPKDQNILRNQGVPERFLVARQSNRGDKSFTPGEFVHAAKGGAFYLQPNYAQNDDQEIDDDELIDFKKAANSGDLNLDVGTTDQANQINPELLKEKSESQPLYDPKMSSSDKGAVDSIAAPKAKFNPEAQPYNVVHKTGGASIKRAGYLKELWTNTSFFSVGDFWKMGEMMWEYYDRRFDTKQKRKVSEVGKNLPYFSPEMQRVNQSAENDEVDQFQSTLDQFGVLQVQERLQVTSNFFEMKAAFIVLTGKGQLRWDDVKMWQNLNQFLDNDHKVPIPFNKDPETIVDEEGRNGYAYLKPALDSLWGEGTYDDWFSSNKGAYSSGAAKYEEEGKELETVEGGHGKRLSELLAMHKKGEFVDPQRFEGLILQSIDYGKASMQEKIYYITQGVGAVNKYGRTIMSFDRLAHINSTYLARFPILEYMCAAVPRPPDGRKHKFSFEDYKAWAIDFDEGKHSTNTEPTNAVDSFMWDRAITSDQNATRINKAMRNAEGIDHDDFFAYLPPASFQVVTDACASQTGGGKKFLTVEGYKNVFPGFNQIFRTLSEKGDIRKLGDAVNSYVRFESIMTNRYEKDNNMYQRLSGPERNRFCITSDYTPNQHMKQLNTVVDDIVDAYHNSGLNGADELARARDQMRIIVSEDAFITPEGKAEQDRVNASLKKFPDLFTSVIKQDNGQLMHQVVLSATVNNKLFGMPPNNLTKAETAARAASIEAGAERELPNAA